MKKSDSSIHNICIASIKRSTMKPYDFKWTRFYESNADFTYVGLQLNLAENELIICSTIIDENNFSILTTRRLLTNEEGQLSNKGIQNATDKLYGNLKLIEIKHLYLGKFSWRTELN